MSDPSERMSTTPVTVGFDIGGTNLRGAVVDESGQILDLEQIPTPQTSEGLESGVELIVRRLAQRHNIVAVGAAIAGFLDPECQEIRFAPHLPWRDAPVRKILEERLELPVRIEHDANSAAWGEYRFGAAQGADTWVLLSIGTGIGATLMTKGEIFRGSYGTAPEFGHLRVVPHGRQCSCGKKGCLERYCSGTALAQTATEMLEAKRGSGTLAAVMSEKGFISGQDVMDAAREGDPVATAAVADFAAWLGITLSMVADVLDPALIVIGGGVSTNSSLYLDAAKRHYAANIVGAGYRPLAEVTTAQLGADVGMIGVANLARELVF